MRYVEQACVDLLSPFPLPYPLRDSALLNIEKAWLQEGHSLSSRATKTLLCTFTIQTVRTSLSQEKCTAATQRERENELGLVGLFGFSFSFVAQETDPLTSVPSVCAFSSACIRGKLSTSEWHPLSA